MHADLALKALLLAEWRRKPKNKVLIHSDQGTQYTSGDWQSFLKAHRLVCRMSRRGNNGNLSAVEFERQYFQQARSV
jgi:putative transposase